MLFENLESHCLQTDRPTDRPKWGRIELPFAAKKDVVVVLIFHLYSEAKGKASDSWFWYDDNNFKLKLSNSLRYDNFKKKISKFDTIQYFSNQIIDNFQKQLSKFIVSVCSSIS